MAPLRLRTDLDDIPVYRQGRSAPEGETAAFKMSSNENPFPPLAAVRERIVERVNEVNRYPDFTAAALTNALAERHGVEPEQIMIGSGSSEIITQLIGATAGPGDEVVFAWRSFEIYPKLVRIVGAVPVAVPLDDAHRHDLDAMARAVTDRTRLIIVCNPNNPTGTTVGRSEFTRFLDRIPEDITVVVDEAYCQFNRQDDLLDGVEFAARYPNVVVARTFSKAYGLAGLRVGYAVAPAPLADLMSKLALSFGVTALAQEAAIASLEAEDQLRERVDTLVAERDRMTSGLRSAGWELPETGANFIWLPLLDETDRVARVLEDHGLIARAFSGEGVRVTVSEAEANDRFIDVMRTLRPN